jgi:hypothetical protein
MDVFGVAYRIDRPSASATNDCEHAAAGISAALHRLLYRAGPHAMLRHD